jgi:hypothetical protein
VSSSEGRPPHNFYLARDAATSELQVLHGELEMWDALWARSEQPHVAIELPDVIISHSFHLFISWTHTFHI